jgi:hypothetical protein
MKKHYSDCCTFIPVFKENGHDRTVDIKKHANGKYDIHFTISVLHQILAKCDELLLSPKDLQFTLVTSIKDLLAHLEVEAMTKR